jgi:hypothetical protein
MPIMAMNSMERLFQTDQDLGQQGPIREGRVTAMICRVDCQRKKKGQMPWVCGVQTAQVCGVQTGPQHISAMHQLIDPASTTPQKIAKSEIDSHADTTYLVPILLPFISQERPVMSAPLVSIIQLWQTYPLRQQQWHEMIQTQHSQSF